MIVTNKESASSCKASGEFPRQNSLGKSVVLSPHHPRPVSQGLPKTGPQVKGLRLQINSQQTGSAAESYFADLVFRDIAQ
jgi:hypothetical protein